VFPEYPFQSNFYLTRDNVKLHYLDEGHGPVILMVHGNPTWSYFYRNLVSGLRENFRVIAVDNMGCGLSDKPQDYPYRLYKHIDNIEELLEKLGVKKLSLVVHDWGGAIGMGYAVRYPDRIEKIVAMNTAAFRSDRIPLRISLCRIPVAGEILVRLCNGFAWPAKFMAVEKRLDTKIAAAYLAPYNTWRNRIAVARFVQDIPMRQKHPSYQTLVDIEKKLKIIAERKVPIMLVWGGADFCFNKFFYEEWQNRFPEAVGHFFPDCGHYVLEDKKEEALLLIDQFMRAG